MKYILSILLIAFISCSLIAQNTTYAMVIHGGAGNITESNMSMEAQQMYRDSLSKALEIGSSILEEGGSSLDAVEATIRYLEDCPLFNAGRGAVFTADGRNELDASIMDGKSHLAGAVAGVMTIKHPITAARTVMENSPHVMLTGRGAEQFAKEQQLEIVDTAYFRTPDRWRDYLRAKSRNDSLQEAERKHGTVGCVAMDKFGNLAAGTSTGGMMMKRYGRVGDSPIIGAGTYADNESCAVSATGHGEYFIRNVVAYDISALMKYKGLSLQEAASQVILENLKSQGGSGGVIALDHAGNISMTFNTEGMFRGWVKVSGKKVEKGIGLFR
jgi:beta-aspartyl-peptidase (threonine type)